MYKITVVMIKPHVKDEIPNTSRYGKSVEDVKSKINDIVLETAKQFNASGEMYIGTIIEEHGKFYESDEANAFISRDFNNITYKL